MAARPDIAGRWLRVSTNAQDEASQEPDIDKWIADHGYAEGSTYRVKGRSAYHGKQQDALDRAIQDMAEGRISVLVAWHPDRIDRRGSLDTFDVMKRARDAGGRIEWAAADVAYLNEVNQMSGTLLAFNADMAHAESKRKSERIRAAHKRIKGNGGTLGRPGYGYRIEGEKYNKRLVVFEPEAQILREIVGRYLAGQSVDAICDELNARQVPGPVYKGQPGKWHSRTLAALLRSPSIAGRREGAVRDENGQPVIGKDGKPRMKTVAQLEPIISWDEHLRLVARLDSRANRKGISPGNVALLTGILRDSDGAPMYALHRRRCNGGYYYSRASSASVPVDEINERVSRMFERSTARYLIAQRVPGENHTDEIERLRQDRSELDDLAADYEQRHAELTAQIRELARQDAEDPNPDRVELVDSGKSYGDVWREMTTAERRDMLLDAGVRVTWHGDGRWEFASGELELDA